MKTNHNETRNKMKRIVPWLAVTLMLALTACRNEETPGEEQGGASGELVTVSLDLSVEPMRSPAYAPATKAAAAFNEYGQRIIASERTDDMLLELVEDEFTDLEKPQTRVGVNIALDERSIFNLHVLQYDGTGDNAKLIKKDFYDPYTSDTKLRLYAGNNQRVVIVANTDSYSNFGSTQIVNSSTYADLLTQTIPVKNAIFSALAQDNSVVGGDCYMQMSGTATGNLTEGGSLHIDVKQSAAKIDFNVKTATTDLNSGTWTFQMCNVPNISYYLPHRTDALFPATVTPVNYESASITLKSDAFTQCGYSDLRGPGNSPVISPRFYLYVPANRRGTVAGATAKERYSKAPAGATYMKLMHTATDGSVSIYKIHLGANFTDDYNLKPNTKYTYNVTLYSDPNATDSRVTEMWDYTDNLTPWFGVAKTDAKNPSTGATTMNWYMATGTYDATNNPNTLSACPKGWRLPTKEELMLMWIYKGGLGTFVGSYSWSATENVTGLAWYVSFNNGNVNYNSFKTNSTYVRCVRDI